jgi:hypothetical protein
MMKIVELDEFWLYVVENPRLGVLESRTGCLAVNCLAKHQILLVNGSCPNIDFLPDTCLDMGF